ncbi:hypothetical protein GQ43DRAFT_458411 [Delitschia confertaspora ATCC 74209]|uniref:NADH dehydrogenase [ubiquinone] 1 beta subcomplex subunit 4 n=1 Tax=Delitschia confertaspora ATCC 74209 TaxID=1513339 RepID=A0A9P4JDW2_9PLEO|nr:hypothetical protein GQ43DRAFT_458411 [Delitschia confertaspora ATCC 74209]
MAGHNKSPLHQDPAILKWYNMHQNRYKHFRWTKRTAWLTFVYVVAVPSVFGAMGYMTDGKWEMRGKRRGDTISEY